MKDQVLQKIKALSEKAKEIQVVENHRKLSVNSLAENIKTKEQADTFKKLLKAL